MVAQQPRIRLEVYQKYLHSVLSSSRGRLDSQNEGFVVSDFQIAGGAG